MSNENDSLGERLKKLESSVTSSYFLPNTPIYARIDGRAFHTFCHGFKKPYSSEFIFAMQETCKELHEKTGAVCSYVQSDEISLGWIDSSKAPFEGRIFKLTSVLASMATSAFIINSYKNGLSEVCKAIEKHHPTFDCRIFNVPKTGDSGLSELANCFLWRENDCIKNSITAMALNFFSNNEIHKKNSDDKIKMMEKAGYDFYGKTPESFLRGTFYHRVLVQKALDDDIVARIPVERRIISEDGKMYATRSEIQKMDIPYRLTDIENKVEVLFNCGNAVLNKDNPTFSLC